MPCTVCSSLNEAEFPTEMMVHLSGSDHLNNPDVMVFPLVLVCLDCGASRFKIPTKELRVLRGEGTVRGCLVVTQQPECV